MMEEWKQIEYYLNEKLVDTYIEIPGHLWEYSEYVLEEFDTALYHAIKDLLAWKGYKLQPSSCGSTDDEFCIGHIWIKGKEYHIKVMTTTVTHRFTFRRYVDRIILEQV